MGAANLTSHAPMGVVMVKTGLTEFTKSTPEKSGQTFKIGVPVQVNAGFIQEWDGATIANALAGISSTPGSNLATNGAGAPGSFGQIGAPGAIQTYGYVPNQPNAFNIAEGTPMTDGRTLYQDSSSDNIFEGTFDNSNGTNAASYTPTLAMLDTNFGLTKDANGTWYVDANKTTDGTNTVVKLVGINPIDGLIPNARVRFTFLPTAKQG